MTIAQVEDMDGAEIEEWKAHIAKRPFTIDMLDHVQAYIRQTFVTVMCGKGPKIEDLLLIKRPKAEQSPEAQERAFRAMLG